MLAKVVLHEKDDNVRKVAADRLIPLLAIHCDRFGKQDRWVDACLKLANFAEHDKDPTVRGQAISFLTDLTLLARVALEEKDESVRKVAAERLTDRLRWQGSGQGM